MAKSLSGRLYLSLSVLVGIIFIIAIYAIVMVDKSSDSNQSAPSDWLLSLSSAHQIEVKLAQLQKSEFQIAFSATPESMQEGVTASQESKMKIDDLLKKLTPLITEDKEKTLLADFNSGWKEFSDNMEKVSSLVKENKTSDLQSLYKDKINPALTKCLTALESLVTMQSSATAASSGGKESSNTTLITMIIFLIIAIITTIITVRAIRFVAQTITDSTNSLRKLGSSSSSIGNSLQSSSESLSTAVTRQAASVHETSAALDEITSMINRTSENAKSSLQVAKESSQKAEEGEKIMEKMVASMEAIQESSAQLQNIANIITQINSKTAVINEIVSKTELLSLNASIESARAGEHGKGFAVVAEEVGNLAKVSGKSANEIQALIQSSQEQVNQIIQSTKLRVEDGKIVTNEAQETFQKISENISNMSSVIEQITLATKEQEIGIRQISASMMDIDKVTKDNQSTVSTNSEFANKLVEQSIKIDETVKEIEQAVAGEYFQAPLARSRSRH